MPQGINILHTIVLDDFYNKYYYNYSNAGLYQNKNLIFATSYKEMIKPHEFIYFSRILRVISSYNISVGNKFENRIQGMFEHYFNTKSDNEGLLRFHNTLQYNNKVFFDIGYNTLPNNHYFTGYLAAKAFNCVQLGTSKSYSTSKIYNLLYIEYRVHLKLILSNINFKKA